MYKRLYLGTAQDTAIVGSAVSTAGAISSVGLTVAGATAAIPIVGAAVAGVEALISLFHIGQGCGNACTESSETEQIFEVAGWDIELAATAGMITQAQAVAALQWLLQQGQSAMQSLESSDSKAAAGLTNLTNTINAQIGSVQANNLTAADFSGDAGPSATPNNPIPTSAPTVALNPSALESSIFVQPGASGWNSSSVSQAASLALQAIANATNIEASASASSSATSPTSTVAAALNTAATSLGLTSKQLLIGAALAIGAILLFSSSAKTQNPRRSGGTRRRLARKSYRRF
jgi:hypothetical protein